MFEIILICLISLGTLIYFNLVSPIITIKKRKNALNRNQNY